MTIQSRSATTATNIIIDGYAWSILGSFPAGNDAERFWNNAFPVPVSTDWLELKGFGFAIPAGATINSITVRFNAQIYASDSSEGAVYHTRLTSTSGVSNTDQFNCPGTGAVFAAVLAGPGTLWGVGFNPTLINSGSFGFQVRANWFRVNAVYQTVYVLPTPSIDVNYTAAAVAPTNAMMLSEA